HSWERFRRPGSEPAAVPSKTYQLPGSHRSAATATMAARAQGMRTERPLAKDVSRAMNTPTRAKSSPHADGSLMAAPAIRPRDVDPTQQTNRRSPAPTRNAPSADRR